jgi:hypothetical protein
MTRSRYALGLTKPRWWPMRGTTVREAFVHGCDDNMAVDSAGAPWALVGMALVGGAVAGAVAAAKLRRPKTVAVEMEGRLQEGASEEERVGLVHAAD